MRLLNFTSKRVETAALQTERLTLRKPEMDDFGQWSTLRAASENFLRPWEPKWSRNELSKASFRTRLGQQEADVNSGRGQHWFLFDRQSPKRLLGGISLTNVRRGIAETGTLGYWVGEEHASKGLMTEAVCAVCTHTFGRMKLHRVEAAIVPGNKPSQRLLEKCGFVEEGLARKYLKINDQWQDHILFARLADDQRKV